MSDPRSTYGEPVAEPTPADDVVARAHDSLAHAEAAQRDAVDERGDGGARISADAPRDPGYGDTAASVSDVDAPAGSRDPVAARPVSEERAADTTSSDPSWYDRPADTDAAVPAGASAAAARYDDTSRDDRAQTVVVEADRNDSRPDDDERAEAERYASYASHADRDDTDGYGTDRYGADAATPAVVPPVAVPVETAAAQPAPAQPAPAQPIFVQAPEAPRPRGNRGAAAAIGLLAAVAFAALYLGVRLALGLIDGSVTGENVGTAVLEALTSWAFWVPVVVFFLAFWLLGAVINRGRWAAWVVLGLLVGLASWAGHILGQLFQAPFWLLTASEGARLVEQQVLAPLAIAAFVIGRELTIWFGAWVASRGRRVTELNAEAQREYERTLEAGPQLARI